MKNYRIKFYYGTDLRAEWEGMAWDELRALTQAMDHVNVATWCISQDFRIEISKW
jgi:hypothetical protein